MCGVNLAISIFLQDKDVINPKFQKCGQNYNISGSNKELFKQNQFFVPSWFTKYHGLICLLKNLEALIII